MIGARSKKYLSLFALACCGATFAFYLRFKSEENEIKIKQQFDFSASLFEKIVDEEKLNAFAISLILSQNSDVVRCFESGKHGECMDVTKKYKDILSAVPFYTGVKIHFHTQSTRSLARSWSDEFYNDDLSSFRHSLLQIHHSLLPKALVEMGRCGVFMRGISPVFSDGNFIGSAEIMLDFEHVIAQINRMGNDIFILVDKRFETDCFYDKIGVIKDFIVVNSAPDYDVLSILATLDFGAQSFIKKDGHYFYVRAFSDENGTKLGYIILHREG